MIKITRFFALCVCFFLVAACCAINQNMIMLVNAACSQPLSAVCEYARSGTPQQGTCPISWFVSEWARNPTNAIGDIFFECHDDGTACCNDPCGRVAPTTTACLSLPESPNSPSPLCIFMPATSTGYQCISKYKLCALNTYANCNRNPLCEYSNISATQGSCGLKLQYSAAETQDFSLAACPALHGAVVAFLVLMFISLVGAIIFVIIVVIIKQRKADEEEKKAAEEAAAAEAAAKAQQEEQADF